LASKSVSKFNSFEQSTSKNKPRQRRVKLFFLLFRFTKIVQQFLPRKAFGGVGQISHFALWAMRDKKFVPNFLSRV